jgi:glycosyltransferase involved in cell wall biosynthesis
MNAQSRRLTIVQYGGDFAEASRCLRNGGPETYRGQRYTVDHVESLATEMAVTTIVGLTNEAYDIVLPSGARAIGAGFRDVFDGARIARLVEETKPDLLILRTPSRPVMRWAIRKRCRTLMLLADSLDKSLLKNRVGRVLLSLYLRAGNFDIVANHGIKAAQLLVAMGVRPSKVLAWDYPAFDSPEDRPAKTEARTPLQILFVGMLIAEKGVDDLIDAVALVHSAKIDVQLTLIGKGNADRLKALVESRGLEDVISFAGLVPNDQIIPRMAAADIIVVPSHHEYSEGMPLTIYEAYCSRTPLIASDHPMFVGNVIHERSGLIFKAGNAQSLADNILRLVRAPKLYAQLSEGGLPAWNSLQIPVKWHTLIDKWIENSPESKKWIAAHAVDRA